MPPDQTSTVDSINKVLATLALTTTPKEYSFVLQTGRIRKVQIQCTAAFKFSHAQAGPFINIPSDASGYLELDIVSNPQSVWLATQSGTGTATPFVAE